MTPTWFRQQPKQPLPLRNLRHKTGKKRASLRLSLEALEERVVLSTLTVNSLGDSANPATGIVTLRSAVNQANIAAAAGSSDTITFNTAAMGGNTITLQNGALELKAGSGTTTINGAGQVTISGNNSGLIFQIDQHATAQLDGLIIEKGDGSVVASGTDAAINGAQVPITTSSGGAINNQGNLTIYQSSLVGNVAGGLYSYGGAIANSGTLTINSSTLSGNSSAAAAGFGGGGAVYNTGTLTLIDSTVANNTIANVAPVTGLGTSPNLGGGGGILNLGNLTAIASTLAGNAAPIGGGIDNAVPGKAVLEDTIVATNSAITAPDFSGSVTGNNNLVGVANGLSGIANADANANRAGTLAAPLNPLLGPLANYGGPVATMALLTGSPAIAHGAAIATVTSDARNLPRPATPDIGAFQSQAIASLAISATGAAIADASFPVTITAADKYGDPVTSYNGAATLASSDKQTVFISASAINLINGTATVPVTLATPNTVTLTATSGVTGQSASIVVSPPVATFAVSVPATATAGTPFNVTITAEDRSGNPVVMHQDAYGNTIPGYSGTVTLTASDGQPVLGLPSPVAFTNGTATVAVVLDKAENNMTLTAAAGAVQGTSGLISVSPAGAASFTVTAPATAAAGTGFSVDITAVDPYGNAATGYSGPVTLTSAGQSVAFSPATPAWVGGSTTVTVTITNPASTPITLKATAKSVSGQSGPIAVEATPTASVGYGLAGLVSWAAAQTFPLVDAPGVIQNGLQNALQIGLVNPINTYLAQNPTASSLTNGGFLGQLEKLSAQVGGLNVAVSGVQQVVNSTGTQVTYSLDFQATDTVAVPLPSLGTMADRLGLHLNPSLTFDATTSVNFNFSFTVDLSSPYAVYFSAPAGGLSASVTINAANVGGAIDIGFLGASISGGTVQLSAHASNAAALTSLTYNDLPNLTFSPSSSLNVTLPVSATLGAQSTSGTVTISSNNLATTAPVVAFQGLSGWQDFGNIGADEVLGMLNQLGGELGQAATQAWTAELPELPFLPSLSLSQAANLGQIFQSEVTGQLETWSAAQKQEVPNFTTAQGLASMLAQVLDVSPSSIVVAFNPTTNDLTYRLSLTDYSFSALLAQSLQVNLDQGALANAGLTKGELSLVPKITASLTVGLDLSPLGHGFTLTPATPLSSLNGGAGVQINGSSPDLQVTLTNGTSFQVSLAGAKTIQDVINDIQAASGGKVTVAIDSTSPQGLDVTQVTPAPGSSGTATFTIAAINGSNAAADLGIAGVDAAGTGTIYGQSLSGDSLDKHVFIQNATVQASVTGTASQVYGAADLGAVSLLLNNGTGTITAQGSMTIAGPTTLDQLTQAVNQGGTSLSSLVSPKVSGSAQVSLPIALAVPLLNYTPPSGAMVAVTWTDITNPGTLTVTVTPALNLSNITIAPVLQGLQGVGSFVQSAAASLLSQQLPGLGTDLLNVINPASALGTAVSTLVNNAPTTIDQLASQLGALLGQPVNVSFSNNLLVITLHENPTASQDVDLGFNLSSSLGSIADVNGSAPLTLAAGASVTMGLAIDLTQPASPKFEIEDSSKIAVTALVNGSGIAFNATVGPLGLSISGGTAQLDNGTPGQPATWNVGLATNPANHLWLLSSASSEISNAIKGRVDIVLPAFFPTPDQSLDPNTPDILLNVTDLSHSASTPTAIVGPALQLVSWGNGSAVPTSGQNLIIAGIDSNGLLHIRIFDAGSVRTDIFETRDASGALDIEATGASGNVLSDQPESSLLAAQSSAIATLKQQLPGLLPPAVPTSAQRNQILSAVTSITGQTVIVPNLAAATNSISLNGIMDQVVDGWDGLMRMLQSSLTQEIDASNIPVVGKQLQQALTFLQTMDQKVTALLENAPQIAATTVQDAIYQTLGPPGLNWLVNLVPGGAATENNYVQLVQTASSDHYLIKLHQSLLAVSAPVAANLGLSGLGLSINGNVSLDAGFDATLGFGVSQQYGFYVDTTDTASVGFTAALPTSVTATLGFLQFNVTNNTPQTPQLSGGLTLGLNNPYGTGRLSLNDLASSSNYTVGLSADASLNLHLAATIAGNPNLPNVSADFYFDWSTDPTASDPLSLGFNNVTISMGGFIDNIIGEIDTVLKPIEPLVDLLSTPLPVLSTLAGHPFTLVDLASTLGLISPGTGEFITQVDDLLGGGLSVPPSLNLGSFTLDPTQAADPTEQGDLNPETTDIQSTYTGAPVPGFDIPILNDPASAFQFLLGKDVPLVTYETPALGFDFSFDEFFPIIGPLGADLAGEIGAQAQFGFGFDTYGLRQYEESNFTDPSLILDGFYVSNRQNPDGTGPIVPQVELYGSIAAYAAVDLGILQAGVGGGLYATIGFDIHDPSGTGRVHLQDLEADFQKGTIFDASGALEAFLDAYVKIDLGFFSHTWTFNIATATLGTIGEQAPSTPPPPQLATQTGGDLRLNIGPYASDRLYASATNRGPATDGNETLTVTPGPDGSNSVYVSGFGVTNQKYDNVTEITGEGAAGGDTITIAAGSSINVDLQTGGGNNTIDVQSAHNVTLTGGAGSDTLEVDGAASAVITGGSGTEKLIVNSSGAATLQAGSGQDALYAGSGASQVLYGAGGSDLLVAGSGAGQVLHGGSGVSTLVGGSGAGQQLFGDSSTANIFGGTGSGQVLNAGTGDAHLYAGEADGQVLFGGSGNDVLQVGWHLKDGTSDTAYIGTNITFTNVPQGASQSLKSYQPLQVGWHLNETLTTSGWTMTNYVGVDASSGASHAYLMQAGTGNTLIIGGRGNDTIHGGSGSDTLYGGGGAGNKWMYAGTGATQMYGGGPGDNASPATGTHILYGGSGQDVLYGGDGCNIAVNNTGTGLVTPGGDGGALGVNILAAASGNTTLYSDAAGTVESTLLAGSGLDKLYAGGDAGDYLEAGTGVDSLYGGTGSDVLQLPFIPAGQSAVTPDSLVGGYGLTTLLLKPFQTELVKGQITQVSANTSSSDNNMYLTAVAGTTNEFLATLHDLDSGALVGQVQFIMPTSVERIVLMGGLGDNQIATDPSVQRGVLMYGGPGHNILIGPAGNDALVGGSGTSILEGGTGNDTLYGGAVPLVYQNIINNLGNGTSGTIVTGAPTSDALMTWLRKQPTGHNVLIAGSGNSQLYAGNQGDLLIGGNATFNFQTGPFVLLPGAGRDVFAGGQGNDLMIGGLGSTGDAMTAGSGNSVLIGGQGQDILEGGSGSDVLVGGSLLNIMTSNSSSTARSVLLGGSGMNFEFAGAGADQLFDYSNPSDPAQWAAWARVQALAASYDLTLPSQTASAATLQDYQNLVYAQSVLDAQFPLLNAVYEHPTQYGTLASGSNTISSLYFLQATGTTTANSAYVTGLAAAQLRELIAGDQVTGTGIPAGTTVTQVDPNATPAGFVMSNVVSTGTSQVLTFSDPLVVAPTVETGSIAAGSTTLSGLVLQTSMTGTTTASGTTVTHLATTASLQVGDTVIGTGIPAGTVITQIQGPYSIILSQAATTGAAGVVLQFSPPLVDGQPVTGPGIPAGTTIAAILSGTSVTLSQAATVASTGGTFTFGSVPFTGPGVQIANAGPGLPAGDFVTSIVSGSAVTLAGAATESASNVTLTFALSPQEELQREAMDTALQLIAQEEVNDLKSSGANAVADFLQGGSGGDSLYAGPNAVWMIGDQQDAAARNTFYVTQANDASFADNLDTIQGGSSADDTLVFLGSGSIQLGYNSTNYTDQVTINNVPLNWKEGNNISTLGVETTGGPTQVTFASPVFGNSSDAAKFGTWTSALEVLDGGVPGTPGLEGNVVIDAHELTEQATLMGGAGNDTIMIDRLAFGSLVQGSTGHNQQNVLEIIGDSGGANVFQGPDNDENNQENLQIPGGTWVGASGFHQLLVVGGSASGTVIPTNSLVTNDLLIPVVVMEGGNGTGVQNDFTAASGTNTMMGGAGTNVFTATGGTNTVIGGTGANTITVTGGTSTLYGGSGTNTMTVNGGTAMLFGGSGVNTFNLNGAGTYTVYGGAGTNTIDAAGGTATITGGLGANQYDLAVAGTYTITGGLGGNSLYVQCAVAGDAIHLSQSGSAISVTGTIGGTGITATATHMTSVEADGSAAGSNVLDASHMTMGVNLVGRGPGNTLQGGLGDDTLDGGSGGDDYLTAGNDTDRLYVSGDNSHYYGAGDNSLVYRAQPNDNVIVYGDGLLVNPPNTGPLVWSGDTSSLAIGVGNCSFVAFSSVSGVGTVQLEDGTGTATARAAQLWDLPGTKVFTDYGSYYANGSTYGTDQNGLPFAGFFSVQPGQEITIATNFSASYENAIEFWDNGPPHQAIAGWDNYPSSGHSPDPIQGSPNFAGSSPSWTNVSGSVAYGDLFGFHKNTPPNGGQPWYNSDVMILGIGANYVQFGWRDREVNPPPYGNAVATVYFSWVPDLVWTSTNYTMGLNQYGLWGGGVTVDPGIQVSNLTVVATSSSGAQVTFPSSFTTGGGSPQPLTSYAIGTQSISSGYQFPIGTTVVTATAADSNNPPNTSTAAFDVTVLPPSPITVTSSAPSSVAEQPVTLTATLNEPGPAGDTPTGTVTFMDGSTVIGAGTLKTTGGVTTASFTTSALAVGSHTITAFYGGDSNFAPLTSALLSQSVAQDATTTALNSSAASTSGQAVTFLASVHPVSALGGVPTGWVQFLVDGVDYGSPVALSQEFASITIPQWVPGTHTISAAYSGDANFTGSISAMISTFAGSGTQGSAGDGGPATAGQLDAPAGLALNGNDLFIADTANNRVRAVIRATGVIVTIAGNGTAGYAGDGGPATAAELDAPSAVAFDSAGDLFIADTGNNVIREVIASTGKIITYAGTGIAGSGGLGGPAKKANLDDPTALAIDAAGDLFIADSGNNRVLEVIAATGIIQTVAGTGTKGYGGDGGPATAALLNDPTGLAVDAAGDLFISDTGNNRVREVTGGVINTVAGSGIAGFGGDGGLAKLATLNRPTAIAVDALGDLLIADTGNNRIREVLAGSGTIITLAGDGVPNSSGDGGPSSVAELDVPDGLAIGALNRLYVSESKGDRVRMMALNASTTDFLPSATTISSSLSSSVYGQSVTFTATVVISSPGAAAPTGTVTFKDGTTTLGTGTLSTSGGVTKASFTTAKLAVGSHTITAVYSGDANNFTSTSPALTFSVAKDVTATTITASPATGVSGQSVTFTATVTIASPGAGTPTGTVTFKDGTTTLGTGTLSTSGGVTTASFTTTKLAAGSHAITAVYAGDSNDATSTSAALSFSVAQTATAAIAHAAASPKVAGSSPLTDVALGVVDQAIFELNADPGKRRNRLTA